MEMGQLMEKGKKKNVIEGKSHGLFEESEAENEEEKQKQNTKETKSLLLCN